MTTKLFTVFIIIYLLHISVLKLCWILKHIHDLFGAATWFNYCHQHSSQLGFTAKLAS